MTVTGTALGGNTGEEDVEAGVEVEINPENGGEVEIEAETEMTEKGIEVHPVQEVPRQLF